MEDYGDEAKSTSCPRGHWRPAEDEKLRQLVEQYGAQNWNSIAEKLQGRSGINLNMFLCVDLCVLCVCAKLLLRWFGKNLLDLFLKQF